MPHRVATPRESDPGSSRHRRFDQYQRTPEGQGVLPVPVGPFEPAHRKPENAPEVRGESGLVRRAQSMATTPAFIALGQFEPRLDNGDQIGIVGDPSLTRTGCNFASSRSLVRAATIRLGPGLTCGSCRTGVVVT
jgi:hypothetical protein